MLLVCSDRGHQGTLACGGESESSSARKDTGVGAGVQTPVPPNSPPVGKSPTVVIVPSPPVLPGILLRQQAQQQHQLVGARGRTRCLGGHRRRHQPSAFALLPRVRPTENGGAGVWQAAGAGQVLEAVPQAHPLAQPEPGAAAGCCVIVAAAAGQSPLVGGGCGQGSAGRTVRRICCRHRCRRCRRGDRRDDRRRRPGLSAHPSAPALLSLRQSQQLPTREEEAPAPDKSRGLGDEEVRRARGRRGVRAAQPVQAEGGCRAGA